MTDVETLISVLKHNGGLSDSPIVKVKTPRIIMCDYGECDPEDFEKTVKAAQENNDIIYGNGYLALADDADRIRDAIETILEREDSPKEFIANANRVLSQ